MILTAAKPEDLTGVAGWVVDLMDKLGPAGAGVAIMIENVFPPLPSEVILPVAGFAASAGKFTVVEAIVWTTVGAIVGAWIMYAIGAIFGRERVYWLGAKLPLVSTHDIEKAERFFDRYGQWTVFLARFIPLIRVLISVPAGVTRMPLLQFTLLTGLGSLIWNTVFVLIGYQLGEHWDKIEAYMGPITKATVAVIAIAIVWWIVNRIVKSRRGTDTRTDELVG